MRLTKPRIAPLADAELTPDQAEILEPMRPRVLNTFRTLAREPKGAKGFLAWGNYILCARNGLHARDGEIVMLGIGFVCRSGDEWTQQAAIGEGSGLSDEEIARIKQGAEAPGWSAADAALLKAADELHHDQFVTDATWAALKAHFDDKQCMDVVFTAGQYTQVSMMLNTFGVQLDEGQTLDPDLKAY